MLLALNIDALFQIFGWLDPPELGILSCVCKFLYALIETSAWKVYLTSNPRRITSIQKLTKHWGLRRQVRYRWISDQNWKARLFNAEHLGFRWARRQRPRLAISDDGLIISRGQDLQIHDFQRGHHEGDSYSYGAEFRNGRGVVTLDIPENPHFDITGLTILPQWSASFEDDLASSAPSVSFCVAREDGTLSRYYLPQLPNQSPHYAQRAVLTAKYALPTAARDVPIKYLASSVHYDSSTHPFSSQKPHLLLALSANGIASLFNANSPWEPPSSFYLPPGCNPWSAYLTLSSSFPFAAIGGSSPAPLSIYPFQDGVGTLSPSPIAILTDERGGAVRSPAAYCICRPDGRTRQGTSFVWGSSDKIVVSGWHDGVVRVHDMRDDSCSSPSSSSLLHTQINRPSNGINGPKSTPSHPLKPVLSLSDPWIDAGAVYCVDIGGGSGSHIVAGQALHGLISVWDARSTGSRRKFHVPAPEQEVDSSVSQGVQSAGWSVYPPHSKSSPTYDLIVEGSRVWGAGQTGPFLFDFGPSESRALDHELKGPQEFRKSKKNTRDPPITYDHVQRYRS